MPVAHRDVRLHVIPTSVDHRCLSVNAEASLKNQYTYLVVSMHSWVLVHQLPPIATVNHWCIHLVVHSAL